MANTSIEKRVDARTELAQGLEAARSGRGLAAAQDDEQAGGFASVLASLEGLTPFPVAAVLQSLDGSGRSARGDGLPDAALAQPADAVWMLSNPVALQPSADGSQPLAADAMLLAGNGQMPWASLVGQTAQLDGKADRDLVQGAAGDWLSGRGNAAMAVLRQERVAGAHAAFMSPQQAGAAAAQAGADAALDGAALATAAGDLAATTQAADAAGRLSSSAAGADALSQLSQDVGDAAGSTPARSAQAGLAPHAAQSMDACGAAVRQDQALASGMALQGMAAVKPEQWRGLFERAREGASDASDATGSTLHGVAAAVGAAHAGQQAAQQGAGQDASAFAQARSDAGTSANASEREQEISEKVAFWVHSKSQNASLTVDHEGQAIQVQVSLQGNEAHVRFGSSEAQAREWLGSGADQLRELLQAQGLQLSGVSVDAGGQPGGEGRQNGQDGQGQARQGRVSARVDAAGVAQGRPAASGARTDGGIDLFV